MRCAIPTTPRFILPILVGLALCALPALAPAQTVHQVGGGGFSTIIEAVQAAGEGDVILVEDGHNTFDWIHIDGKSLTIVAEGSASIFTFALSADSVALRVSNLAAHQRVVVRGIEFRTTDVDPETAGVVEDCEGAVLIEDCVLRPGTGTGLHVTNSASVTLHRSTLSGGSGQFNVMGLRVEDARVFLHESTVLGGDGSPAQSQGFPFPVVIPNGDGGDGARIVGASEVFMSGGEIRGGNGGSPAGNCFVGGDAGDGLVLGTGSDAPLIRTRHVTVAAGVPTAGGCGLAAGSPGAAEIVASGAHVLLTGAARDMTMSRLVTVGGDLTVTFDGQPDDQVVVLLSLQLMPGIYLPAADVALHVAIPFTSTPLGMLPGGAPLDVTVTVPSLPAGLAAVTVVGQAVFTKNVKSFLGGPTQGTILAP